MLYKEKTDKILKAFYKVYNTLGYGFLEKVYENAMMIELKEASFQVAAQRKIIVYYNNNKIGDYFADLIVDNEIIIELKANEYLVEENEAQLLNYLKATNIEVGLLLNFGKTPQFKRKLFTNDRKK